MRRLILAPHADDETFGCGGLIAKYPDECVVAVFASPTVQRASEFDHAMVKLAGAAVTSYNYGLPDGNVGADLTHLVTLLDDLLKEVQPGELYLPYPSSHQDHRAVYEGGVITSRLSMHGDHWFPPAVLVYDVPTYDLPLYPSGLTWNTWESLSLIQVRRKADAIACYESEAPPGPHPTSNGSVLAQARALGVPHGVEFAEQYCMVRSVRR